MMGNIFLFVFIATIVFAQEKTLYKDSSQPIEIRVEDLLKRMTLKEKVELIGGKGFESRANERLGIPEIKMCDGPVGVRWEQSTAFPVSIAMAASWDTDLINKIGIALGKEIKAKGRDMLLGPCINIVRTPFGGRNFESFGEDPYLTSRMAISYINGVQSEKVLTSLKHFATNNQETERMTISSEVDERTLREIYLRPFELTVKEANPASLMSAYNKLNGIYCSENNWLLHKVLRREWGFNNFVVSDWGAVHSTEETAKFGVDLEMPNGKYLNEALIEKVNNGEIPESVINDKVHNLLKVMFEYDLFTPKIPAQNNVVYENHKALAREAAEKSIVLLKNDNNLLPLNFDKIKSIAVIGPTANTAVTGGGGSSRVNPFYSISPLKGIKSNFPENLEIDYAQGCNILGEIQIIGKENLFHEENGKLIEGLKGEYFQNMELDGSPLINRVDTEINFAWNSGSPDKIINEDNFSIRWNGFLLPQKDGDYELSTLSDDGVRVYLNDDLIIDNWSDHATSFDSYKCTLKADKKYKLRIEYYENGGDAVIKFGWVPDMEKLFDEAKSIAKKSDVVLVFAGTTEYDESEGFDKKFLSLPENQIQMINEIAKVNKNIVVVLNHGAPLIMREWIDNVPAVITSFFPGQEGGNAIAKVLTGEVNPSGKLPYTIPKSWEDSPAYGNFPGSNGKVFYKEGIYVGYRYYDTKDIQPEFEFGFGMSYTNFQISNISLSKNSFVKGDDISVTVNVKNTGNRAGGEVVQLYISDLESSVDRPKKELKKFQKLFLEPGSEKKIQFKINYDDLCYYDIITHSWKAEAGEYEIYVGNSSNDKNLQKIKITLN